MYKSLSSRIFSVTTGDLDMDSDQDMDVLAYSYNLNRVVYFENDGNQVFTMHVVSDSVQHPLTLACADLDQDGDKDIVCATQDAGTGMVLLRNDGNLNFTYIQKSENKEQQMKTLKSILLFVIIFWQSTLVFCQTNPKNFPVLRGPYLGQTPPGNQSKVFAQGFVSTEFGELNSVFTRDGSEFYFSRRGLPGKPSAIMVSRMLKAGWTIPVPVDFTGTCSDIDLFITSDNRSMVFCSTRPHQKGGQKKEDHDFWISKREGNKWSEPALFANEASSGYEDFFPVVTASGNLYFNSQRGGLGTNDIFCAKFSAGKYTIAEKLPEPINTKYREFDAFVSPDETMILFSSERPGGYGGADIYLSWKKGDGSWGEPRNLGSDINSAGSEYGASMSYDGKYFFYTSNKGGSEDIFWVSADVIKELRQKPLSKPKEICTVTYIANEGFLIGTENKKILVDALFGGIKGNWCDQPGDSISRMMIKGIAPFDSIDVVLLTHLHSDHFNSGMTIDFLKANRKSVMICPDQVNERLKSNSAYAEVSDRITAIKSKDHPDTIIGINGINIRVMHLKHGSWFETDSVTGKKVDLHEGVENLGYLIESDGTLVLHTGDCNASYKAQFTTLNLSSKEIDVAFFDRAFLKPEGLEIIAENIHSRNIILMHIESARREYYKSYIKDIPGFYVFNRQMEKMIIVK